MCYYGNTPSKIQDYLKQYEKEWTHYFWNEFVLKNENKINWEYLSKNPNITWEIVKDNPDKPWDWFGLSRNPNITMEIVKDNLDKDWDWVRLSFHPFKINKQIFIERKLKEHMMAFRIQTYLRRANYDPKYKMCQNRLMRECDMLGFE